MGSGDGEPGLACIRVVFQRIHLWMYARQVRDQISLPTLLLTHSRSINTTTDATFLRGTGDYNHLCEGCPGQPPGKTE
jgi:hypothetical protein